MSAAVFSRSLVILVCPRNEADTDDLESALQAMGFTVVRCANCDQAMEFPPSEISDVHAVIACCCFASGPSGEEAVESLYRHFLGVPLALLPDANSDEAGTLGKTFGFTVLTRPVRLDELARVMVKAHFERP